MIRSLDGRALASSHVYLDWWLGTVQITHMVTGVILYMALHVLTLDRLDNSCPLFKCVDMCNWLLALEQSAVSSQGNTVKRKHLVL